MIERRVAKLNLILTALDSSSLCVTPLYAIWIIPPPIRK